MATEAQIDLLRQLYVDPEFGLQGTVKFTKKVMATYKDISKSVIQEFLKKQTLVQVNTPRKSLFKGYYKIVAPPNSYQLDLFFLPSYKSTNDGISTFMIFIDILSRKMWVYPVKNRTAPQLLAAIKKFHDDVKIINMLQGDDEFNMKSVIDYCAKHNIMLSTSVSADEHFIKGSKMEGNTLAIVDAAIRTIKTLIRNYILAHNSTRFIDKLDSLVKNYNNTDHSAFKDKTPNEVFGDADLQQKMYDELHEHNKSLKESIDIDIGDFVRVAIGKKTFDKGNITFSTDIYVVADSVGKKYQIMDENGDELKRLYRYFELQKITDLDKTTAKTVSDKAMNEERGLHLKTVKLRQQLPSKTYSEARNAIVSESSRLRNEGAKTPESKKKVIQRNVQRSTDRVTRSGKVS